MVVKWAMAFAKAGLLPPRVMGLENVEEFDTWGPLLLDGKPDPEHEGRTYEAFRGILTTGVSPDHPDLPDIREALGEVFDLEIAVRGLGYVMESRQLRAFGFGAPTSSETALHHHAVRWPPDCVAGSGRWAPASQR